MDVDFLKECFNYDLASGLLFWKERPIEHFYDKGKQARFNNHFSGKEAGTVFHPRDGSTKYRLVSILGAKYYSHRIIWCMVFGEIPENGIVDSMESSKNRPAGINNKSGVIGICWNNSVSMWEAKINANGKRIFLGRTKSLDKAILLRKEAEEKYGYHKNHGRLKGAAVSLA